MNIMKTYVKNRLRPILPLLALSLIMSACANDSRKEESAKANEQWTSSLDDSIRSIQRRIDSCRNNIDILHDKVGSMLEGFVAVNKSREVEGYTIRNGWQNRYPLQNTGIIARISADEGFELVAAYRGAPFSQIQVSSDGITATSDVVPQDQGLNYRRGNLTTVLFTGEKADSIGRLITDNSLNAITMTFIGNGNAGSYTIPHSNINMIADTWNLYSTQKEVERMEREVPRLNQKINIIRQTIDRRNHKQDVDR